MDTQKNKFLPAEKYTDTRNNFPLAANDIVDIQESDAHLEKLHPRFFKRVFTPKENELLQKNPQINTWKLWAAKEAAYKYLVQKYGKITFAHKRFEVADDFSSVCYFPETPKKISINKTVNKDADKSTDRNETAQTEKIPIKIFPKKKFVYALANESFFLNGKDVYATSYIFDAATWKNAKQKKEIQEIMFALQQQYSQKKKSLKMNEFSLAIRSMSIFILANITSVNPREIFIENLDIPHTHIPAAFYLSNNSHKKERLPFTLSFTHHGDFFALYLASTSAYNMQLPQNFFKEELQIDKILFPSSKIPLS